MTDDTHRCSLCGVAFKPEDVCADDITEGTCHAECLGGSPVVDLETGDEIPDGKIDTYLYSEVMDPKILDESGKGAGFELTPEKMIAALTLPPAQSPVKPSPGRPETGETVRGEPYDLPPTNSLRSDPAPETHAADLTPLESKYLSLAQQVVKGGGFNHPDPRDDEMRLVGFRVPVEIAGLSEALFALDAIRAVLTALTPATETKMAGLCRPTYQQIKDAVQANINRMHDAGESHPMMARWLSADLNRLYPPISPSQHTKMKRVPGEFVQRVFDAIDDVREPPEEGCTWEGWFYSQLDDLSRRIGVLADEMDLPPSPETNLRVNIDRLAASIVTAACELDGPADPAGDDTISITTKDLEAVVHRHVTAALEAAR